MKSKFLKAAEHLVPTAVPGRPRTSGGRTQRKNDINNDWKNARYAALAPRADQKLRGRTSTIVEFLCNPDLTATINIKLYDHTSNYCPGSEATEKKKSFHNLFCIRCMTIPGHF